MLARMMQPNPHGVKEGRRIFIFKMLGREKEKRGGTLVHDLEQARDGMISKGADTEV